MTIPASNRTAEGHRWGRTRAGGDAHLSAGFFDQKGTRRVTLLGACLGMAAQASRASALDSVVDSHCWLALHQSESPLLDSPDFRRPGATASYRFTGGLAGDMEAGSMNSDMVSPRCSEAESGEEGRLTRPPLPLNPLFTMAIQCIPKPCSCRIKGQEFGVRKGYTHPKQTTCPFAVYDFPMTRFGTCCSFKMDAAQSHLYIFGEDVLAERMDYSMTAEQALYFAEDLRRTMGRLEARYQGAACKPEGGWHVRYWHKNKTEKVYKRRSTFEDAVAAIGQAATWYELVGRLGYGVAVK